MSDPQNRSDAARAAVSGYSQRLARGAAEPLDEFLSTTGIARDVVSRLMRELEGAAPPAAFVAERIGRYETRSILGRGGMGTVFLAHDTQLDRDVALKRIRPELLLSQEARRRFANETKAASRLDHPNICKVFDAGDYDGQPFLVMQYIRGDTIAAVIAAATSAQDPAPAPDATVCLDWVEKVARGLHHAHQHGLIHRDVKPSNVLVTPDGEPFLLDFGLARPSSGAESLTATGAAPGTFRYMSPEQLRADAVELDGRTDVFSLAVVLSELMLLRHPFAAETEVQMVHHIQHEEPLLVARQGRRLGTDLTAVLRKALHKDRAQRYATAAEFADDLGRVRRHEPIAAARQGRLHALRAWAQEHPLVVWLAGVGLTATVFAPMLGQQVRAHERQASIADSLQRVLDAPADPMVALARAVDAAAVLPSPATDQALWRSLSGVMLADSIRRGLGPDSRGPTGRAFAYGEEWVQVAANPRDATLAAVTNAGWVQVTRIADRSLVAAFQTTNGVSAGGGTICTFDARGDNFYLGGGDGFVHVFRASDWTEWKQIPLLSDSGDPLHGPCIEALCLSPDGRRIAVGGRQGHLKVHDLESGKGCEVQLRAQVIAQVAFDASSKRLLVGQRLGDNHILDALSLVEVDGDGSLRHRELCRFSTSALHWFAWHPDGRWVALATADQVRALEVESGRSELLADNSAAMPPYVRWCAFDATGRHLLAGVPPGLAVMDWHDGRVTNQRLIAHPAARTVVAGSFHPRGDLLAVLFADASLGLLTADDWRLTHCPGRADLATHHFAVAWVDDEHVATTTNTSLDTWKPPPGNLLASMVLREAPVYSVDAHPTQALVVAGSADGSIRLDDHERGVQRRLECGGEPQRHAGFSPDGRHFLACGERTVRVFATDAAQPLLQRRGTLAAFVGNDRVLVADGETATVVDLADRPCLPPTTIRGRIQAIARDAANGCVFVGGNDRDVWQIFLDGQRQKRSFGTTANNAQGPGSMFGNVMGLAAVPGAQVLVASCVNDRLTKIDHARDPASSSFLVADRFGGLIAVDPLRRSAALSDYSFGRLSWLDLDSMTIESLAKTDVHTQRITALEFSPSGRLCLSASLDGTVCLWNPADHTLRTRLRLDGATIHDACFTADEQWIITADGRGRVQRWAVEPLPVARQALDDFAARSR